MRPIHRVQLERARPVEVQPCRMPRAILRQCYGQVLTAAAVRVNESRASLQVRKRRNLEIP